LDQANILSGSCCVLHQSADAVAKVSPWLSPALLSFDNVARARERQSLLYARASMQTLDRFISSLDTALRTVAGAPSASRPSPAASVKDAGEPLDADERRLAGALMRVNHVGEVCAQALYRAQGLTARTDALRRQMAEAAREETDHLAWTRARLDELGARPSLLNPLWYAGAFGIGLLAGRLGDDTSLGFVVETERQVEAHLARHLERLPLGDQRSRAIVAQMREDEKRHGAAAEAAGAAPLPAPVKVLMAAAARVMTTTAHRL
jgi:ubiquinone biosynthesis monooxygenase Coq7